MAIQALPSTEQPVAQPESARSVALPRPPLKVFISYKQRDFAVCQLSGPDRNVLIDNWEIRCW